MRSAFDCGRNPFRKPRRRREGSPRPAAQKEHHRSVANARARSSGAALGVFEWDPNTDHTVWENDRIYEIFGRSRADGPVSKRQFVADYLHRDDADAFEAAVGKAVRTRDALHVVCRFTRKAGGLRWLQIDGKFEATATGISRHVLWASLQTSLRASDWKPELRDFLMAFGPSRKKNGAAWPRELHNSTVQRLVAAALILTSLKAKSSSESTAPQDWDGLEASLEEAMKELRTFSYLMHPPALRGQHLDHSLQQYVDAFCRACC